jgi:hypothetical protein
LEDEKVVVFGGKRWEGGECLENFEKGAFFDRNSVSEPANLLSFSS